MNITDLEAFSILSDFGSANSPNLGVTDAVFAAMVGGVSMSCVPHFALVLLLYNNTLLQIVYDADVRLLSPGYPISVVISNVYRLQGRL